MITCQATDVGQVTRRKSSSSAPVHQEVERLTLQGTDISPPKACLKIVSSFPKWDIDICWLPGEYFFILIFFKCQIVES